MSKRRRGQVVVRGKKFGARVHVGGKYVWLGTHYSYEQAEAAIEEALATGTGPTRETVGDFAKRWIRDYPRPSESTNHTKRNHAKRLLTLDPLHVNGRLVRLSAIPMRDVDRQMARAFALRDRYLHPTLRSMFNDAIEDGLLGERAANPFAGLRLPKSKGRANIIPLTPEEVDQLADLALEVFADEDMPDFALRVRAMILMAAYTCIRPGELFALERSDVDVAAGVLHVRRRVWHGRHFAPPKTGEPRTIVLLDQARDAYLSIPAPARVHPCARCEVGSCQRIFSNRRGRIWWDTSFGQQWSKLRERFEAELPPARRHQLREARTDKGPMDFYELRHVGASYLWNMGVPPQDIAFQLGHANTRLVEETYGHPDDAITRERIRRTLGQNVRTLSVVEGEEAANG